MEFSTISIPQFQHCDENGNPVFGVATIEVIKGLERSETLKFERIAQIEAEQCKDCDCIAAVPDSWQIRPEGSRPQLIIQFGEDLGNGKIGPPKYEVTIPHYVGPKLRTSPLPRYRKGNWEFIYVLNDNSKVTVNAFDEVEGNRILDAVKRIIHPGYLTNAYCKDGHIRKGEPLAEIFVVPKMAKYFSTGQKNLKPDWIARFS